jgi:hypothetical protein
VARGPVRFLQQRAVGLLDHRARVALDAVVDADQIAREPAVHFGGPRVRHRRHAGRVGVLQAVQPQLRGHVLASHRQIPRRRLIGAHVVVRQPLCDERGRDGQRGGDLARGPERRIVAGLAVFLLQRLVDQVCAALRDAHSSGALI